MKSTIIIGTQWGDEGKGKFVDIFSKNAKAVVRYNGSGGAAHTVVNKYGTTKLHLLPCGVFNPKTKIFITNGVAIEPELLIKEIEDVKKMGIKLDSRLYISPRCHLVFPYHKILDKLTNALYAMDQKTSPTTGRGNGPVNADRISYQGIRLYDLFNRENFTKRLKVAVLVKNKFINSLGGNEVSYQEIYDTYLKYFNILRPYITETLPLLEKSIAKKEYVLFEGVNGFLLDNDWGAYPFVTTASVLPSDIARGAGVSPQRFDHEVVGIAKAYMTRVDNGECPLPTEWEENADTKKFRDMANEYGSGTGRPRRICWFDTEVLKTTHRFCNLDYLCLTRLDTLRGIKKIKIGIGYVYKGKKVNYLDGDAEFYRLVQPVYKEFKGWDEDISKIKKYKDLPQNVRIYVEAIEKLVGVQIKYISTGPKREEVVIHRRKK
jgi:adenylosuccinate synthase